MSWPTHDNISEYFMDIGTHMIEKNGLYLERYAIWNTTSTGMRAENLVATVVLTLTIIKLM